MAPTIRRRAVSAPKSLVTWSTAGPPCEKSVRLGELGDEGIDVVLRHGREALGELPARLAARAGVEDRIVPVGRGALPVGDVAVAVEDLVEARLARMGPRLELRVVELDHLRLGSRGVHPVCVEEGQVDLRRRDDDGLHAHEAEKRLHLHDAEMPDALDLPRLGVEGHAALLEMGVLSEIHLVELEGARQRGKGLDLEAGVLVHRYLRNG